MTAFFTKRLCVLIACAALLQAAGCSKKREEVSSAAKKEAAMLVSEAQFAIQVREFARARELFERAVKINPNVPDYWIALGIVCRKLEDRSAAKSAYREALEIRESRYKEKKTAQELIERAYLLGLLGRTEDAFKLLDQGLKEFPDDSEMKRAADPRGMRRLFQSQEFKDRAI